MGGDKPHFIGLCEPKAAALELGDKNAPTSGMIKHRARPHRAPHIGHGGLPSQNSLDRQAEGACC